MPTGDTDGPDVLSDLSGPADGRLWAGVANDSKFPEVASYHIAQALAGTEPQVAGERPSS
jgi:hypothetical protein